MSESSRLYFLLRSQIKLLELLIKQSSLSKGYFVDFHLHDNEIKKVPSLKQWEFLCGCITNHQNGTASVIQCISESTKIGLFTFDVPAASATGSYAIDMKGQRVIMRGPYDYFRFDGAVSAIGEARCLETDL